MKSSVFSYMPYLVTSAVPPFAGKPSRPTADLDDGHVVEVVGTAVGAFLEPNRRAVVEEGAVTFVDAVE
jgi:hypothetical protein